MEERWRGQFIEFNVGKLQYFHCHITLLFVERAKTRYFCVMLCNYVDKNKLVIDSKTST